MNIKQIYWQAWPSKLTNNSISTQLAIAGNKLKNAGLDTFKLDAQVLLCKVLGCERAKLYTWPEYDLTSDELINFTNLIKRRVQGEPIAYIVKHKEFFGLDFFVNQHVLIPRPDTEVLVQKVLELIPEQAEYKLLDLGTGSGNIAISIAKNRPNCQITAIDYSLEALAVAWQNIELQQVTNVKLLNSNWYQELPLDSKYDFIVSNPPYIEENDPHLELEISYEPLSALVAKDNGLQDIAKIARNSVKFINDGGYILIEHGWQQAEDVQYILQNNGYINCEKIMDINQIPRVSLGSRQK